VPLCSPPADPTSSARGSAAVPRGVRPLVAAAWSYICHDCAAPALGVRVPLILRLLFFAFASLFNSLFCASRRYRPFDGPGGRAGDPGSGW